MSTVHHQEYPNTVHTQQVFVMLVLLANKTSMTNTYWVYCVPIILTDSGHVRNM
jgi:hypothetical protein